MTTGRWSTLAWLGTVTLVGCVVGDDPELPIADSTEEALTFGVCGEPSCQPVTGAPYFSHFTNPDCTGTEYYHASDFNGDDIGRSWNGTGYVGKILARNVTLRSHKSMTGACTTIPDFTTNPGILGSR